MSSFNIWSQDHVTIYQDCQYGGRSHALKAGNYLDRDLGIGNDVISAIRIPKGWRVTVYTDNNFKGVSRTFDEDVVCIAADLNDKISSIRVAHKSNHSNSSAGSRTQMITLYEDCNFRGTSHSLRPGNYVDNQLGIGNDRLSSIRIPSGMRVTLYTDNNFKGSSRTFDENVVCMPADLNDKISSIRVTQKNNHNSSSNRSGNKMITLYVDCDYRGSSHKLGPGTYIDSQLGIGNDRLSSLRIPSGMRITLYTDNNKRGERITLDKSHSCLPHEFNDRVSSVHIERY